MLENVENDRSTTFACRAIIFCKVVIGLLSERKKTPWLPYLRTFQCPATKQVSTEIGIIVTKKVEIRHEHRQGFLLINKSPNQKSFLDSVHKEISRTRSFVIHVHNDPCTYCETAEPTWAAHRSPQEPTVRCGFSQNPTSAVGSIIQTPYMQKQIIIRETKALLSVEHGLIWENLKFQKMSLNVDQELFGAFAFYSAIVVVKMLFMSFLTARWCLVSRPTRWSL